MYEITQHCIGVKLTIRSFVRDVIDLHQSSNLSRCRRIDTVVSGYDTDTNFLSEQGNSSRDDSEARRAEGGQMSGTAGDVAKQGGSRFKTPDGDVTHLDFLISIMAVSAALFFLGPYLVIKCTEITIGGRLWR